MSDIDTDLVNEQAPGTPKWVKVLIALFVALVLALAVGKLAGVQHGPGMHSSGSPAAPLAAEPASAAPSGVHTPSFDHGAP